MPEQGDVSIKADKHEHGPHRRGHTHGAVDQTILTTERGIWAIKC